jgi:hypothetical protein
MTSLELSTELRLGLKRLKDRDGVRVSEQIRRAVRAWLEAHGIDLESLRSEAGATSRGRRRILTDCPGSLEGSISIRDEGPASERADE